MSTQFRPAACILAVLALACAGPAVAQTTPTGRAWTDPPARGAAVSPPQPTPDVKTVAEAPKPSARAPTTRTPITRAPKPKTRVAAIRHRPVAVVRTVTPTRPGLGSAPVRIARARIVAPDRSRPVRYGFIAPPPPPAAFYEDPRVRRIRQAEAAGYLVVRRTTVAAPDGRLLYGYRPYAADEIDD